MTLKPPFPTQVVVYEKRKTDADDGYASAFFCALGLVSCDANEPEEFVCAQFSGADDASSVPDDQTDDDAFGHPSASARDDIDVEPPGPAAFLRESSDPLWVRLGSTVPADQADPTSHVPKPASLDKSFRSFARSDVAGQIVTQDWHVHLSDDADTYGWSYAPILYDTTWHPIRTSTHIYRRQIWHRYSVRPKRPGPGPTP